mgnify:CR=1 FL=1
MRSGLRLYANRIIGLYEIARGRGSYDVQERNVALLYVEIAAASVLSAAANFNSAFALRLGASNSLIGLMTSLPALIIQRADPGLYNLLTNGILQARLDFDRSKMTCRAIANRMAEMGGGQGGWDAVTVRRRRLSSDGSTAGLTARCVAPSPPLIKNVRYTSEGASHAHVAGNAVAQAARLLLGR